MSVVLVGAPGSGKSTVGALLAAQLGVPFTDIDAEIENREGRLIREIFASDGEAAFRELEREVTLAALGTSGVVSLGGGAPMTPEIAAALGEHTVVWLAVDAHHALKRVGVDDARPLLAGTGVRATLIRLLNERTPVYRRLSTIEVDTSGQDVESVVGAVLAQLVPAEEGPSV